MKNKDWETMMTFVMLVLVIGLMTTLTFTAWAIFNVPGLLLALAVDMLAIGCGVLMTKINVK
jgi:membrane protein required for beta-lactamase induction